MKVAGFKNAALLAELEHWKTTALGWQRAYEDEHWARLAAEARLDMEVDHCVEGSVSKDKLVQVLRFADKLDRNGVSALGPIVADRLREIVGKS